MDTPELARLYLDALVARDYDDVSRSLRARVHFAHSEAGGADLSSITSCDSPTGASRGSISSAPG